MNRLSLTPDLLAAVDAVAAAERVYVPGRDSASVIELPKLALANAVLAALEVQRRTDRLPHRAGDGIVYVRLERLEKKA